MSVYCNSTTTSSPKCLLKYSEIFFFSKAGKINICFSFLQLSGLLSEKYVLKACLSHGKRLLPRNDDGYPHRILPDHSVSNPWNRERFNDKKGNKISKHSKNREHTFDFDQDLDGVQDDTEDIEEAALCPGGRLLRLNVSATEHVPQ